MPPSRPTQDRPNQFLTPTINARQITCFVALFEEGSMTRAARRLNVVQPAVSMQLRKLEEDFGVTLFERGAKGLAPTAVAREFYPMCLDVLSGLHAASRFLRERSGDIAGAITIGVSPSIAQSILGDFLVAFNRSHPRVAVRCFEGYSSNIAEWLSAGILDFAFVNMLDGDSRLSTRALLIEELVVVTRRESDADDISDLRGADLARFRLVLPSSRNSLRTLIDAEFGRSGIAVTPALEVDSFSTVLTVLENPGWASIIPGLAIGGERGRRFTCRALVEPSVRRVLSIAYSRDKGLSTAGETFIAAFEREIAARSPAAFRRAAASRNP